MRFGRLIWWDMRFQVRYGFYLLYGFLTALYLALLFSLPGPWRKTVAALLVFSDPAAMGLFFMGAIVLLEKSQRIPSLLAVLPVSLMEYVCSKALSLSLLALLAAAALAIPADCRPLASMLLGTLLSSVLFTLAGMLIAAKTASLNQFVLAAAPVEMLAFGPACLHLAGITPASAGLYPANFCIDLIAGRAFSVPGLMLAVVLMLFMLFAAQRCVRAMWREQGGAGR
ncbi:MAG: ABC transporter permease [Candidatus Ventricola sp.]